MAQLTRDDDVGMQTVGRYEVVLDRAKTSHDDFTDLPLLAAQTVEDAETRARDGRRSAGSPSRFSTGPFVENGPHGSRMRRCSHLSKQSGDSDGFRRRFTQCT
jgi:hypothetical protein